jgi:hypothetical protein
MVGTSTSNIIHRQNGNNLLHGVRGVVWVDGKVQGAVQRVTVVDGGTPNIVRVMGSRYIQAKEIADKVVNGTIDTLLFDPTDQLVMKLTDPTLYTEIDADFNIDEVSNVLDYDVTQLAFNPDAGQPSLFPIFDIEIQSKVSDGAGNFTYHGFKLHGCLITTYQINFEINDFWIGNITFMADKVTRINRPIASA